MFVSLPSLIRLKRLLSMSAAILITSHSTFLQAATPAERGQWMAAMGGSGLRGFYASGSDLGEMVNRAVSYQTAQRVFTRQQANPATASRPQDMRSRSDTWVVQSDSLIPVAHATERPLFVRALLRSAGRDEAGRVDSRNDRLDLGLIYAPSASSFLSFGFAAEFTQADIFYVTGETSGKAWGPRIDAGLVLGSVWAVGMRADYLEFSGDNEVSVMTGAGPLNITRDVDYQRRYLQLDAIARLDQSILPWLPDASVLSWTSSFRHLHIRNQPTINSLGQPVAEPFGERNRLSVIATGVNLSYPLSKTGRWSVFGEVMLDYELETNMNLPIDDRTAVTLSSGIVRQLARGKRMHLQYDRYQHVRGTRSRNNLSLIATIDF
ncbi:hypothetical protein [Pseudohongiella sp.]|uniref:Autotransporter domain-containing protein n=1 Tax=marine sediment metagenome TaxID=412755 RepID=A0A0F9W382_9ZZZZ|nr:hypothetical protein [Pseudohongiella sp.]HDZ08412.1 hypothetical protein [Pseudohongiella sp.]HEA62777.1 hypothetical protein [Pseudohongiella sp.]